jgi:uncharacterized repeat protein (TIGR01451 family)
MAMNASFGFSKVPPPTTESGAGIDLSSPVALSPTKVYHPGEPIFITLADKNRNVDTNTREMIKVTLVTATGDHETLIIQETGPDTGVFAGVIQSIPISEPLSDNNGFLSISENATITVSYVDPDYPDDIAKAEALVDPFGFVFNSVTGAPVNGATVSIIVDTTGAPATVFGDDGTTEPYPNSVTSGAPITTGSRTYLLPNGGFRFPFVAPGTYRLIVIPPTGFSAPSTVPLSQLQSAPSTSGFTTGIGSFGDRFTVVLGATLRIDIPIDPANLIVEKRVNKTEATIGDFVSYQITVTNKGASVATGTILTDILPLGFRYQTGSARQDSLLIPDPIISADGRSLTFSIGTMAQNAKVEIRYVAEITSGTPLGMAINQAVVNAVGALGPIVSNVAQVAVKVSSFGMRGTIIGRVVESACNSRWENLKGVPNVRIMMEDGTYLTTDRDGQYHFEQVEKGTHVVQLDIDTIGPEWQIASCIQNTRFAGRSYSQFVEMQEGMLWRADFYVHKKQPIPALDTKAAIKPPEKTMGEVTIGVKGLIEVERKVALAGHFTLNLHFDTNKAILSAEDKEALNNLVADLKKKDFSRVDVTGHTDIRPTGLSARSIFRDNYHLSMARADVVTQYLSEALNLPLNRFLVTGKGPDEPVADNKTAEGMSKNRRTEVTVMTAGEVKDSPRFKYHVDLEGKAVPVANLRVMVNLQHGFRVKPGTVRLNDMPLTGFASDEEIVTFSLPNQTANFSSRIDFDVYYGLKALSQPTTYESHGCLNGQFVMKVLAIFDTESEPNVRTPPVANTLPCVIPRSHKPIQSDHGTELSSAEASSEPIKVIIYDGISESKVTEKIVSPSTSAKTETRSQDNAKDNTKPQDDITAAGGNTNWLLGQTAGVDWLFPPSHHNPRSPVIRVVMKHLPSQKVILSQGKEMISPLLFDGTEISADKTVAVSIWRGIPLKDGKNWFNAEIIDLANGRPVSSFSRVVHYSNQPAHISLVPNQSLIADGINSPVLAVRITDKNGWPVRSGVTGPFTIAPPFFPMQIVDQMQNRQLAGMDLFKPMWQVTSDDGIALIKLQPTSQTGELVVVFPFEGSTSHFEKREMREEIIRSYVAPAPRDFVVVGFAEGTVGYNTLKGNMQGLGAEKIEDIFFTEGQTKFYAKGRIRGDWLLTLAYDSDKPKINQERLFQVIDPNAFYTLYGDGTSQLYDASSQRELYLKLEKNQFSALFGDFETGMTKTELMRYSRALNGVKVSYQGKQILFTAFAAETPQNFVRDEIQGLGTSGLYRLSRAGIVLNGERVTIETRDRLKSERIIETKSLTRHLDYDIDYPNGTLFFRSPVPTRDTNFNPVFIVVEYEVTGGTEDALNAGGRVGIDLGAWRGATGNVGFSYIRNADRLTRADVSGLDLQLKIPGGNALRLEGAASEMRTDGFAGGTESGSAYLAEITHQGKEWDLLLYTRLQSADFGVNQQNSAQSGMRKTGVTGKVSVTPYVAIFGEGSREENLLSNPTRDIVSSRVEVSDKAWRAFAGLQNINDTSANGASFDSRQAIAGANTSLFNNRLSLEGKADISIGGHNESLDYPSRYVLQAGLRLTDSARLIVAHEIGVGDAFDTQMTRVGLESNPWKGARLTNTLNQNINEYGPRTFGVIGLSQSLLMGERWGLNFAVDQSRTFSEVATGAPNLNPAHPIAVGGTLGSGAFTEDYVALSAGATYRKDLWSWNGRIENRHGEIDHRLGLTTGFLHEAKSGVAFMSSLRLFETERMNGVEGLMGNIDFALAYRPLGSSLAILDKLQFRYETLKNGSGTMQSGLFGNNSLVTQTDAKSRALIHHFSLNKVSRVLEEQDRKRNLFHLNQRHQGSLYYGSKYSFDQYAGVGYKGYTDLLGIDLRHDFSKYLMDIGFHGDILHSWQARNYKYSVGPMIGISPIENAWITVGYNFKGFYDRDFEDARYTAVGPYIKFRIKFDQNTQITSVLNKEEKP